MRELSSEASWIRVKSVEHIELVVMSGAFNRPTGEGEFAIPEDKSKIGVVLANALKRRMLRALESGDIVRYRLVRNMQSVHLRGLEVSPELDIIPKSAALAFRAEHSELVEDFFIQNGFMKVNETDSAGYTPLHYAALLGDPFLIKALLEAGANLLKTTRKGQALLGLPPWVSAVGLCAYLGHNEAARVLISARASVQEPGSPGTALHAAAHSNNVEGISILCEARCDPWQRDIFGRLAHDSACDTDSFEALQALLNRTGTSHLSKLLHSAASSSKGGSVQVIQLLIDLRADVDERYSVQWMSPLGALVALQSLRYRCGQVTSLTRMLYHIQGATPLMLALLTGNHQSATLLIMAGATLELQNARNYTAAELVELPVPEVIEVALSRDAIYCRI